MSSSEYGTQETILERVLPMVKDNEMTPAVLDEFYHTPVMTLCDDDMSLFPSRIILIFWTS